MQNKQLDIFYRVMYDEPKCQNKMVQKRTLLANKEVHKSIKLNLNVRNILQCLA